MRCLLALLAVAIGMFMARSHAAPAWLYAVLVLYLAYSATVLGAALLRHATFERAQPWVDVVLVAMLVALTGDAESPFIHYFLFAVIVASFTRGFLEGLSVTACATAAFALIGTAGLAFSDRSEASQAVTATISLFLLGYLIAYWGGREVALRRRLGLLRELAAMGNPRAQPDQMMRSMLHRLLGYYDASSCVLIVPRAGTTRCTLYRATQSAKGPEWQADEVGESLASKLLALPAQTRITFDARPGLAARAPTLLAWGPGGEPCGPACANECMELSTLFEAPLFATVPFKNGEAHPGRLFLISPKKRLNAADAEYLSQVTTQIATAVSNVTLFEELTRSTAQSERSRISRDIHDTTVQSYIGLKIALEALYRDIDPSAPAAVRVKELLDMATLTVDDLRRYIDRLSGRAPAAPEQELIARLEEQKRRYQDYHGMNVELRTPGKLELTEEVAGEAYRVVCEALSNVFRHTSAREAYVDLRCEGGTLAIEVGNESVPTVDMPFMPRSITERATSIGGKVQVRRNQGHDVVRVTVPLQIAASKRRISVSA
ncbi:MAG TPA: histidine kinase [Burkholderiales bacterium]|nr:histidine kinase [Burkholderiales bacterium]